MGMPKMRAVPEKARQYAKGLFEEKGELQYTRKGRHVKVFCTVCGMEYSGVTRLSESYEAQAMEKLLETPVHGAYGKCIICRTKARYKALGRCQKTAFRMKDWMMGQRMGEDFVFRLFETDQMTGPEMKTGYKHTEYARVFLRKGKKPGRWFFNSGWGWGAGEWYTFNVHGKSMYTDNIYPDTMIEIDNTPMLKYGRPGEWDVLPYYEAFARYPDMELAQKLGMRHLVRMLICQYGANINPKGKTVWDRLRIYKERMKDLKEVEGEAFYLQLYQEERRRKEHWTKADLKREVFLKQLYSNNDRVTIREVLKHTTVDKVIRYKEEQRKLNTAFDIYLDYIRMRLRAGYDLNDEIILFPKDLRRRHDEMVLELEKEEMDKRKREVMEKYPKIAERFGKLQKKYGAVAGEFVIRPARNAAEIVEEGRMLHHCVGGNEYLKGHEEGKGIILFLRKASEPDIPFCTIEIRGTEIRQWYEAYDKKPDEEILQPILDEYVKNLEEKKNGRTRNRIQAVV